MDKIWSFLMISIILYYLLTNSVGVFINILTTSYTQIFDSMIIIFYNICIWSGFMNIFSNTSIINILNKMLNPLVNILFTRKERKNFIKEDYENIVMNIVSNIIGLGNAATAIGLKEMSILDERKEEKAMKKFVLLNSASIQLFPLSIIGIRIMNNSSNPYIVVIPILISSFIALFLGMISLNILNRFSL